MSFRIIRILFWINWVIRFILLKTVRMLRYRCVVHETCMMCVEFWTVKNTLLVLTAQTQQALMLTRAPARGAETCFPSRAVPDPCHVFDNSSAFHPLIKAEICLLKYPQWNASRKEMLAGILVLVFLFLVKTFFCPGICYEHNSQEWVKGKSYNSIRIVAS